MIPYANRSGKSGVAEYELGDSSIKVRFVSDRTVYVYDYSKPGAVYVEQMKRLAVNGKGLATYIGKNVKKNFARKE